MDIRFILNLKRLNSHKMTASFKTESLQTAHDLGPSDLVCPNGWVSKVDLKSAYYTVPVAQESKNFLAFHWQVIVYHFLRMPLNGFNQAHREFTKLLKPVAADLRAPALRT